jgi:hypothetical protein
MEFYQQEDYLYCLGGYGYSAIEGDHTTFANLTALYVPGIIDAVINNTELTEFVRQINDPVFQVTGGHLNKINDVFHLLGGQKFIGRYNPMGPDHGPGFIQEYTNQVRRFTLNDDGTNIVINHLPAYTDSLQLHRRDYNTAEQIMPDGSEGVTMFSGVFRPDIDLPYLNSVDVSASGYEVNNNFTQYYNHYHCAVFPLYSEQNNEMHTVFFGGIAQYYDSAGILVQDDNVPFVKTIARVTRNAQGEMNEYKLPVEMPDYLGAGAEFIPNKALTYYTNGVLNLDALQADTTLAGYVFGGISSSAANIFFINTGAESIASSQIYKVYLVNNMPLTSHHHNAQSSGSLKLEIFPNPGDGDFYVKFNLDRLSDVNVSLYNASGKKVDERLFRQLQPGEHMYQKRVRGLHRGGIYSITVETPFEKATRKIIIE